MSKITLYTAVPVSRLISIAERGLLTNDKVRELDEFNQDEEMQGRIFDESSFGYIYATTDLINAVEWCRTIHIQEGGGAEVVLEYEVDEDIITPDKCSPNKSILDVRIRVDIKPENLTVVQGELSLTPDKRVEIESVEKTPLLELFDQMQVRCENCREFTRYKDMVKYAGMRLCKDCANEGRKFAEEIGLENVPE